MLANGADMASLRSQVVPASAVELIVLCVVGGHGAGVCDELVCSGDGDVWVRGGLGSAERRLLSQWS